MFFNRLNKYRLPIILAAFLILASGCGRRQEALQQIAGTDTKYGGAIVVASIGDARSLIPMLATDSASAEICSLVYNGLVKYDRDTNLVGDLAKSWEVKDEGIRIIFHLRKN